MGLLIERRELRTSDCPTAPERWTMKTSVAAILVATLMAGDAYAQADIIGAFAGAMAAAAAAQAAHGGYSARSRTRTIYKTRVVHERARPAKAGAPDVVRSSGKDPFAASGKASGRFN